MIGFLSILNVFSEYHDLKTIDLKVIFIQRFNILTLDFNLINKFIIYRFNQQVLFLLKQILQIFWQNFLISLIMLFKKLLKITAFYIDFRLIITLILVEFVSPLYSQLLLQSSIINRPFNRLIEQKHIIVSFLELFVNLNFS